MPPTNGAVYETSTVQPENAENPMLCTFCGTVTDESDEQPEKAYSRISKRSRGQRNGGKAAAPRKRQTPRPAFTVSGKATPVREEQFSKRESAISHSVSGRVTDESAVQPRNVPGPSSSADAGSSMVRSETQESNAYPSISVRTLPRANATLRSAEQPGKRV